MRMQTIIYYSVDEEDQSDQFVSLLEHMAVYVVDNVDTYTLPVYEPGAVNAWPEDDLVPCIEAGEHFTTQEHPFEECPTYSEEV